MLKRVNPLLKVLLYLQLLCVAIWGPVFNVAGLTVIAFVFLLVYRDEDEIVTNPYYSVALCLITVLIVLPGGSWSEILYATNLAVRILAVMLVSSVFGLWIDTTDIMRTAKVFGASEKLSAVLAGVARFVPVSIRTMRSVLLAQRSRGLEFDWAAVFRLETYPAVVVPYFVCILRIAFVMWISMNLRPHSEIEFRGPEGAASGVGLLLLTASCLLWLT